MKYLVFTLVIALYAILSVGSVQASGSVELPKSSDYKVDPNYPAIIDGTNGRGFFVHAEEIISISLTAFMMRYDRLPTSWQEVVDKGFASDRYLMAPDGRRIDPDDGKLDFEFDVTYIFNPLKMQGRILRWWGIINKKKDSEVTFPPSFADQLKDQRKFAAEDGFSGWENIGNEELFFDRNAVYLIIKRSIWYFHDVNGRYPTDLAELFGSRLCPLGSDPVNPVTHMKFSESSGDKLEYVRSEKNFWLYYLGEDGERTTMLSMPVYDEAGLK